MSSRLAALAALLLGGVAMAASAQHAHDHDHHHHGPCDGVVALNETTGNIDATYLVRDEAGEAKSVTDTFVSRDRFRASIAETRVVDEATGRATYTYAISNAADSEQQIHRVYFAIPREAVTEPRVASGDPAWELVDRPLPDVVLFGWRFAAKRDRPDPAVQGLAPGATASFSFVAPAMTAPLDVFLAGRAHVPRFSTTPPECVQHLLDDFLAFPRGYRRIPVTGPAVAP
jgi:hypothetical protein